MILIFLSTGLMLFFVKNNGEKIELSIRLTLCSGFVKNEAMTEYLLMADK